ncbi:MAG: helix-turn-helix domain-containing protein [Clostridia bacterium]|nr:helix-turn-helix domain-containing protein [Clostridia bacterium]
MPSPTTPTSCGLCCKTDTRSLPMPSFMHPARAAPLPVVSFYSIHFLLFYFLYFLRPYILISHTVPFEALPQRGRETNKRPVPYKTNDTNEHSVFDADDMKMNNILGKKITQARKQKKISQRDLATIFKDYNIIVSSGAISKWEKGDALPNPYQLLALCQILDIRAYLKSVVHSSF